MQGAVRFLHIPCCEVVKMTRKEIIDGLKFTVDMCLFNATTGETYTEPRNDMDKITVDACRGAIEALKAVDDIKTEIKALPRYGSNSNRYLAVYVDIYEVLKIINKHTKEGDA